MSTRTDSLISLKIAPAQVIRGSGALKQVGSTIAQLGSRPLLVSGDRTLPMIQPRLESALTGETCTIAQVFYRADCSELALRSLRQAVAEHRADLIIGSGGGKTLDAAKQNNVYPMLFRDLLAFMKKILLLGALLGLASCGHLSSQKKSIKSLKTIQSWTATAQMVGETWQQGAVPDAYAEQTLEKSQEEIAKETKAITGSSAQHQTQQIQQTLQQLTAAVNRHQKAAIAAPLQQLLTQHQQLDAVLRDQEQHQ